MIDVMTSYSIIVRTSKIEFISPWFVFSDFVRIIYLPLYDWKAGEREHLIDEE